MGAQGRFLLLSKAGRCYTHSVGLLMVNGQWAWGEGGGVETDALKHRAGTCEKGSP